MSGEEKVEAEGTSAEPAPAAPAAPLLRIITPNTTPEEVAAIVAVLSALGGGAPEPEAPRSVWADPGRKHRYVPTRGLVAGPGGWRTSALPR